MQKGKNTNLLLQEGSKIGVIGGGPAGSFFTFFAFDLAQKKGINIEIDIYEPKNFKETGAAGCNHCGGIVSESLVQMLSEDGIILPPQVIRRGIESYTLHLEQGKAVIDTLLKEQRIFSVFRGSGPSGQNGSNIQSFDGYLLELCEKKGAKIYTEKVIDAQNELDGVNLVTRKSIRKYDLVVGAVGLNTGSLKLFDKIIPRYVRPQTAKTFISEYYLENETISRHFGNSMHVFLLNIPGIKFGALIPKGNYVTLVLLGTKIKEKFINRFLNSKTIKACFPEGTELKSINPCQCFPAINIKNAKHPYSDRIVLVGDSASSKLYKNGIGAAYITAKAAAQTAFSGGISGRNFKKTYQPVCTKLDKDNAIGKLIFFGTSIIQRSSFLKSILFRMLLREQQKEDRKKRNISRLLWDIFTGSTPYQNILIRGMSPIIIANWFRNFVIQIFKHSGEV